MSKQKTNKDPVSREEFEQLRGRLEDMEDRMELLQAKSKGPSKDALPDHFAKRLVNRESPLRVWREFRGLTQDQLSQQANVSKTYMSEVETGIKGGSTAFFKACAAVLDVAVDDII